MDISCDVIRDLLPLYAEDLVSDASREMVDAHLCQCDPCTKQLGILKKAAVLPVEVDLGSLKRVEKSIRRRKILTVVAAVFTVLTVLISAVGWLNVSIYLDPEDAIIDIQPQEDGSLQYVTYDYVMGHSSFGWHQDGYEYECYAHTWNTTRLDYLTSLWKGWMGISREAQYYEDRNYLRAEGDWDDPRAIPESAKEVVRKEDCHHWHLDAYTGKIGGKLWGEESAPEPDALKGNYSGNLQKNFWGAVCLAVVFAAASRIPGKPWLKDLMKWFAILFGCVAVSQLFLTGGKFVSVLVSDEPFRTLRWIYTITVFLTLTILLWRQLFLMNQQDKGI